jgi:DNA-binding transcriptional MerR regulator
MREKTLSPEIAGTIPVSRTTSTEGPNMSQQKIHYQRWLYGKHLIGRLKEEGFSQTEISRVAAGHGETPGWTTAARENRTVMKERHIRSMEKYLAPTTRRKKGRVKGDNPLWIDQRRTYRKMLERLNIHFEWSTRQIADALGYTNTNSVVKALKTGGGGMVKLQLLTTIIDALNVEVQEAMDTSEDQDAIEEAGNQVQPELRMNGVGDFEAAMGNARIGGQTFLDTLKQVERNMPPFMEGNMKGFIKQVQEIVDQLG